MSEIYSKKLKYGRFETWTSRPELEMHQVKQVHGTEIATPETLPCEADGIVVSWQNFNLALAIKTADCMPISIEGEKGVVFLHAGWRGLAAKILTRPELSLIVPQIAFIGPSIHQCCFEVSEDFEQHFPGSPHFVKMKGKLYFNLIQEAILQLKTAFPKIEVEHSSNCTCCDQKFNSYRRNKTTERNWNIYIKG